MSAEMVWDRDETAELLIDGRSLSGHPRDVLYVLDRIFRDGKCIEDLRAALASIARACADVARSK